MSIEPVKSTSYTSVKHTSRPVSSATPPSSPYQLDLVPMAIAENIGTHTALLTRFPPSPVSFHGGEPHIVSLRGKMWHCPIRHPQLLLLIRGVVQVLPDKVQPYRT